MNKPLTLVIPIFNEEEILEEKVAYAVEELSKNYGPVEILLCENGSVDSTKELAPKVAEQYPGVKALIDNGPADYGQALLDGINAATHDEIAILELDYLDLDFLARGYDALSEADLIIGSKKISPGIDRRPFKRKVFTELYNFLLRVACRVKLTETHGLKVLRKSKLQPIANQCVTGGAVWPSELCIRAALAPDVTVKEIKLSLPLEEIRTTRIKAIKRLRKTLQDINTLRKAVRSR